MLVDHGLKLGDSLLGAFFLSLEDLLLRSGYRPGFRDTCLRRFDRLSESGLRRATRSAVI
jgi:hypothetical protein